METDSKRVHVVRIYRPKLSSGARGIRLYNIVLLVLYVVQISWVVSTIGEPYRLFLLKADREGFQGRFCDIVVPGSRAKKASRPVHAPLSSQSLTRNTNNSYSHGVTHTHNAHSNV